MATKNDPKKAAGNPKRGLTKPAEPGPTPGSAEGDRETVEQSLREKERGGKKAPRQGAR